MTKAIMCWNILLFPAAKCCLELGGGGGCCSCVLHSHDSLLPLLFQAYIRIYQGEELPHPKSMLQVGVEWELWEFLHWNCHEFPAIGRGVQPVQHSECAGTLFQM